MLLIINISFYLMLHFYYLDFYYHLQTQIIMNRNILIITGGTGGHVIPAVNFGNYLIDNGYECIIFLDERGIKYSNNLLKRMKFFHSL